MKKIYGQKNDMQQHAMNSYGFIIQEVLVTEFDAVVFNVGIFWYSIIPIFGSKAYYPLKNCFI